MARAFVINVSDVRNAVEIVKAKGKNVNPYQIKKVIGRGSEATIAYYLKALGEDLKYDSDDELTTKIANLVRPLAIELTENSQALVEQAQSDMDKQIERETQKCLEIELKYTSLTKASKEQEFTINQLKEKVADLSDALSEAKEGLARTENLLQTTRDRLAQELKRNRSLEGKLKHKEEQQTHFMDSLLEEKKNSLNDYRVLLNNANEANKAYRKELKERVKDVESRDAVLSELNKEKLQLKEELSLAQLEANARAEKHTKESKALDSEISQLSLELTELKREKDQNSKLIEKIKMENSKLQKALKKTKGSKDQR